MKEGRKQSKKICLCDTVNLVQRCSALAQLPSWALLLTEMAEGHAWHIVLLVQSSLLISQSGSSLCARPCDGSTQKGAQHREHSWEPITRHCLVQLHWRGQICDLTNCAITSVTLACPQNFHGGAHTLQCYAKFVGKTFFWLWKTCFNHVYFPLLLHLKKHVQEVFIFN